MRLPADENIPFALIVSLRGAGHDVMAAAPGSLDAQVARLAAENRRALLTQDKNFGNILEYPPKAYAGIILIRLDPPLIQEISRALDVLFRRFAPGKFRGRLFVLDHDGIRIRE
jgi:predicted nuclease of predicted toxin-antitoxin system